MASDQRERILDAMVTVAARYGYSGASVARVLREAGVSRATFYECFADRGDCFLAVHRRLAARIERELGGIEGRPGAAILGATLSAAERDPAATRVLLLESLAAPRQVRVEHDRLLASIVAAVDRYIAGEGRGARFGTSPRALFGGVAGALAIRVFRGEASGISRLRDDLLAWVASYAVNASQSEIPRGPRSGGELLPNLNLPAPLGDVLKQKPLPRGRAALSPSAVAERQRKRILAAVAQLARAKGYSATSVADLVSTAGITREAFYEQFRGKHDAFLATQAFSLEESVSLAAGSFFNSDSWPDRVWNGLAAMFSYVAAQPDLVYVDLIESFAAGPAAIRRSFENRMAFTIFLEEGFRQRPEAEALPRIFVEAIAGAIHELLRFTVQEGRSEQILDLLPEATYLAVAPFLGTEAAAELIASKLNSDQKSSSAASR